MLFTSKFTRECILFFMCLYDISNDFKSWSGLPKSLLCSDSTSLLTSSNSIYKPISYLIFFLKDDTILLLLGWYFADSFKLIFMEISLKLGRIIRWDYYESLDKFDIFSNYLFNLLRLLGFT